MANEGDFKQFQEFQNSLDKSADIADRLSDAVKQVASNAKEVNSAFGSTDDAMADIQKKMQATKEVSHDISKSVISQRDYSKELFLAENKLKMTGDDKWSSVVNGIKSAQVEQTKFHTAQEESIKNADKLSDNVVGMFDKIPIVSKYVDFSPVKENLAKNVTGPLREGMLNGKMSMKGLGKVGIGVFSAIGQGISTMMKNPMVLFAGLAISVFKTFLALDKAGEDFRRSTGLTVAQTRDIDKSVNSTVKSVGHLGIGIEEAYKAAGALSSTFGKGAAGVSKNVEFVAAMNANLGISEETSAKTLQNFMGMGNMSSEAAKSSMVLAASLAEAAGVAPNAVMQDMANASEKTKIMMRGNVEAMMRLAVESRRVGISIESVSGAARGHLDFQSSINAEMEMSTLLGKNINLQKMRQLAFEGDLEGMLKEQQKQLKNVGDITKMNAFQQEAVAKAFGMSVDELINMQAKEKINSEARANMNEAQLKALEDQAKKTKEIQARNDKIQELEAKAVIYKKAGGELTKEQKADMDALAKLHKEQVATMTKEQKMQAESKKAINAIKSVWTQVQMTLAPIVEVLVKMMVPVIEKIASKLREWMAPFTKVDAVTGDISIKMDEFKEKIKSTLTTITKISVALLGIYGTMKLLSALGKAGKGPFSFLSGGTSKGGGKGLASMGKGLRKFGTGAIVAAGAMVLVAASMWIMTKALQGLTGVSWDDLKKAGVVLAAMAVSVVALGAAMLIPGIQVGVAIAAAAMLAFGASLLMAGKGIEFLGRGVESMGTVMIPIIETLGEIVKTAFEALPSIIETAGNTFLKIVVGMKDAVVDLLDNLVRLGGSAGDLMTAAAGITAVGGALTALAAATAVNGFANLVGFFTGGGNPVENMIKLSEKASGLTTAAKGVKDIAIAMKGFGEIGDGLEDTIKALDKLDSLEDEDRETMREIANLSRANAELNNSMKADNSGMEAKLDKNNELLSQLITMMANGHIAVNMSGKKISEQIASDTKYDF
jgi:head-tail adaptor